MSITLALPTSWEVIIPSGKFQNKTTQYHIITNLFWRNIIPVNPHENKNELQPPPPLIHQEKEPIFPVDSL